MTPPSPIGWAAGSGEEEVTFPEALTLQFKKAQEMRYGENPHQQAAFYVDGTVEEACIATPASCRARRCPTTTSPIPTLPWSASSSLTKPLPVSSLNTPTPAV
jgi:hypothetical protein